MGNDISQHAALCHPGHNSHGDQVTRLVLLLGGHGHGGPDHSYGHAQMTRKVVVKGLVGVQPGGEHNYS